jgi:putative solute:sodium symporter small subunit
MSVILTLASYGSFGGGALGDLFSQWEAAGIFAYALPFLLIFALVFGLLMKLNIFASKDNPNKGVNVIIALAVAFMSLQFDMVSMFFSEIFPRFGVALSIILVILILGGLFMPTNKESNWFMVALAVIVFVIIGTVVYNSLSVFGWGIGGPGLSYFWSKYGSIIIFAVIIIAVIAMMTRTKDAKQPRISNLLSRALGED